MMELYIDHEDNSEKNTLLSINNNPKFYYSAMKKRLKSKNQYCLTDKNKWRTYTGSKRDG